MTEPSHVRDETESVFPTGWHMCDDLQKIECRQLSEDTFQLRSPTHYVTISAEGFELYREGDSIKWNLWLDSQHIKSIPRSDV